MSNDLLRAEAMDSARLAEEHAAVDKAKEGLPDRLRTSGVLAKGPTEEEYDYQAADMNGVSFSAGEGGVDLPIKYKRGSTYAGRDAVTGELYQRRNDPNGYGARGNEKLGAAYVNTENGPSQDVMDGTVPLTMEHIQNGGSLDDMDFPLNDDIKAQSVEAVKTIASQQVIADKLRDLPEGEEVLSESDSLTMEDMVADQDFLRSAGVVGTYHEIEVDEADLTPEYLAEKGVEEMAAIYSSMWKMGEIILAVENGSMPPEVQQAYLHMAQKYEQFTPWSMDVLQGTLTGMVSDIPVYAAMARTGKGTMIAAGKQKAFQLMIQKLSQSSAGKMAMGTAPVTAAGAAEGFGLGAGGEMVDQKLSGESDWQQVFQAGTNEALAGAIFATPFGMLFNNEPGRAYLKRVGHRIADEMSKIRTPMNSQGGWVGQAPDSYNGRPQVSDLGVPLADADGGEFFSPLRQTLMEGGLMSKNPNKGSDPAIVLKQMQGRAKKGEIRGYEIQESQVEAFLQGKIDAGETVSRTEMDDYLWANRPRVNALISTQFDYEGPGSMNFSLKEVTDLRRSGAITVVKENYFDTEQVMSADGQMAWKIRNRTTGEEHVTINPGVLDSSVREMVKDLSDEEVVSLIRANDRSQIMAPPRWGKPIGDRGSPTIVQGDNANDYQEIRLFIPYNGLKNDADIALNRFGKTVDDLTPKEAARVAKIKEYANTPENAFRDEVHYPLEHNRLVHIRTQALYQPQYGRDGQKVLAVNEFQSDMHQGLKKADKETEGGSFVVENSDGTEKYMPSKQATEGWVQMTLNRTFQVAQEQGFTKVAIPVDEDMISKIQLWKEPKDRVQGVLDFYKTVKKMIGKDKRLQETWGITDIKMDHVAATPDGMFVDEKMLVITFDPAKQAKGPKPMYGIAAISGAEGATMMDDEETN